MFVLCWRLLNYQGPRWWHPWWPCRPHCSASRELGKNRPLHSPSGSWAHCRHCLSPGGLHFLWSIYAKQSTLKLTTKKYLVDVIKVVPVKCVVVTQTFPRCSIDLVQKGSGWAETGLYSDLLGDVNNLQNIIIFSLSLITWSGFHLDFFVEIILEDLWCPLLCPWERADQDTELKPREPTLGLYNTDLRRDILYFKVFLP